MSQSLNDFSLRPYALDDRLWAGSTHKLITARNALDGARLLVKNIRRIVAYTVGSDSKKQDPKFKLVFLVCCFSLGSESMRTQSLTMRLQSYTLWCAGIPNLFRCFK